MIDRIAHLSIHATSVLANANRTKRGRFVDMSFAGISWTRPGLYEAISLHRFVKKSKLMRVPSVEASRIHSDEV